MSERKVLNKYYPPDFDPSKVPRNKKKLNDQKQVRFMAPFNMKCTTCGEYIGRAKKFNSKKENAEDKKYQGIMVYRILINCPRCMGKIVLITNPKEACYEVESGATKNFEALELAEKQAFEEAEAEREEEKINPMKHLENRTNASKRQMEASEQIQNIRLIKRDYHQVDIDKLIHNKHLEAIEESKTISGVDSDEEDLREEALKLLRKKAITNPDVIASSSSAIIPKPSPILTKPAATKKPFSSSLNDLKKKIKITKPNQ